MLDLNQRGESFALCTITAASGSVPRHVSSKMLVYENGEFTGTVGGGELEHRVLDEAWIALSDGKPRKLNYSMTDPARGDPGVCGGQVEVFVEPILPAPKVIVIGGGPTGLACAIEAKRAGFDHLVIEKGCVVNSLLGFPQPLIPHSPGVRTAMPGRPVRNPPDLCSRTGSCCRRRPGQHDRPRLGSRGDATGQGDPLRALPRGSGPARGRGPLEARGSGASPRRRRASPRPRRRFHPASKMLLERLSETLQRLFP